MNTQSSAISGLPVETQRPASGIPATQALFQIGELSMGDCALGLVAGLVPVTVLELSKLFRRAIQKRRMQRDPPQAPRTAGELLGH